MTTTTPDTFTTPATDAGIGLREGFAEVGDVKLHYVEAGDGPLVVLLHGFPEFWYGWREQIAPLVKAGYRVVAPDLRGYNLSSGPEGFDAYTADKIAGDIRGLIRELGAESAMVVGHDWGGTAAWTLAANHPEVVDRLVILNAAHPRKLNEGLRNLRQLLRTWYFFYFQFPRLPERRARRWNWRFFKRFLRDARPSYTAEELDRYVEAWSQPGAAKAIIDYYRAAVRLSSKQDELSPISTPTLVIWGQRDRYLGPKLAEPHHEDVPGLDRVERLPDASHWVHHDEAERVNELLVDFLAGGSRSHTAV
jgi:epoxide hydrolase 4